MPSASATAGERPSRAIIARAKWAAAHDARRFIKRLNRMKRKLHLSLPSEAQWEYACRAGTTTATYAGPLQIQDEHDAPVLDAIAWYAGNSWREFELENGIDLTGGTENKRPAGTHPVGRKKPNAWGLHDMLGNVWEWCADEWHDNHDGVAPDGSARDSGDGAAGRVFRGGSWLSEARSVRAACQYRDDPSYRSDGIGFRCARGRLA